MVSICRHNAALLLFVSISLTLVAQDNELRPNVNRIVNKLRQEKVVHFGYPVGYAARPERDNKYYKLYIELKGKATEAELIQLTKDTSECIVVYSFDILFERKYPDLKRIFLQHQNDTTFFWTAAGCTGMLDRINWFMLRRLKPDKDKESDRYLTEEEYKDFCANFRRADKNFFMQ